MAKIITERFAFDPSGMTVDREKGVIRNVRICGEVSANGRKYPTNVLRRDFPKYENAKVYFDHARQGERSVRDVAGWLSDVKPDAQGIPRGNLNLYLSDPNAAKVLEAAERNPNQLGLSHVADCKTKFVAGVEVIESIEGIASVDIVTDPATNKGLFEAQGAKPVADTIKIKALFERIGPKLGPKKWLKLEKLLEMDAAVGDMEMAAPADDDKPEDSLADALKTLVASLVDSYVSGDLSPEDVGGKVTAYLKAHAGEVETEPESEPEETPSESKKKPAKGILESFDPAAFKLELIADLKKELAPKTEAEKPKSGGKLPPKSEAKTEATEVPTDPKELKKFLLG